MISIINYLFETDAAKQIAQDRYHSIALKNIGDNVKEDAELANIGSKALKDHKLFSNLEPDVKDHIDKTIAARAMRRAAQKGAEEDVANNGSWRDEASAHGGKAAAVAGAIGAGLAAHKLYKMYKNKKK